jgi:hypothetical protein
VNTSVCYVLRGDVNWPNVKKVPNDFVHIFLRKNRVYHGMDKLNKLRGLINLGELYLYKRGVIVKNFLLLVVILLAVSTMAAAQDWTMVNYDNSMSRWQLDFMMTHFMN